MDNLGNIVTVIKPSEIAYKASNKQRVYHSFVLFKLSNGSYSVQLASQKQF